MMHIQTFCVEMRSTDFYTCIRGTKSIFSLQNQAITCLLWCQNDGLKLIFDPDEHLGHEYIPLYSIEYHSVYILVL